jgi:pimeloyl-ACP methyl ester carboxylesterase
MVVLWGAEDKYVLPYLGRRSADLCDDAQLEVVAGATHWLHHEESGSVNWRLLEFFGRGAASEVR